MELKFDNIDNYISAAYCSNRTFMELKWSSQVSGTEKPECSNRTFMELKSNTASSTSKPCTVLIAHGIEIKVAFTGYMDNDVLIAPLWN